MKTSPIQSVPDGKVPGLLIFGNSERKEFRLWWENLTETVRERAKFAGDLAPWIQTAAQSLEEKSSQNSPKDSWTFPDFIILLRSWSGEYSDSQVLELRRHFPLTPILAILGSFCEGEGRNGTPLRGVHSLSWFDFAAMAPLEWCAFEHDWATIWSLPSAVLPEHQYLFERKREESWKKNLSGSLAETQTQKNSKVSDENIDCEKRNSEKNSIRVQIESDDFNQFVLLRDFWIRNFGREREIEIFSSWKRNSCVSEMGQCFEDSKPLSEIDSKMDSEIDSEMDFFFFDFPDFHEKTLNRFYALKKRFFRAVPVAFTEFPRPDEWQFLRRCGVHGIFPKPFRIADLRFFCLQHWVE